MSSPPPRSSKSRYELDWVVVSIEGLRRWGLLIFFVVLAAGTSAGVFYFLHEPIDKRAVRMVRRASSAQEELRRTGVSDSLQAEFDQASRLLEEARKDLDRQDYPACLARAKDSLQIFELLSGLVNKDFVGSGQVIALQGKVEVQRANQTKWERAREKMPLYNGDFVKTAADGTAEILFSDGTVYRIGYDSLLEVHREARGGKEPSSGEVKVKVGQVNVYTAMNASNVLTDSARAEVQRDSRVGVEVAEDSGTTVAAYAGRAAVTGSSGQRVELGAQQAVSAAPGGALSERRAVPEPPVLEEPATNALVNLDTGNRVGLRWRRPVAAQFFELQVSRSRQFAISSLEFPTTRRTTNDAALKILRPGTYYWRVAAIAAGNVRSEWSIPRAFKAVAGARVEELVDNSPPRLEVQKPTQMGNLFIVQGVTNPGATVTVNGEVVEVGGDGTFKKAVACNHEGWNTIVIRATSPAGISSEDKKQVFVEGD